MWWIIVVVVVVAIGGYVLYRMIGRRRSARPLCVSLVYLLKGPRQLSEDGVRACASRAFGVTFDVGNAQATEFVVDVSVSLGTKAGERYHQSFIVQVKEGSSIVHNVGEPYVDNPDKLAASIPDLRLRQAVAAHRAWLSVDALSDVSTAENKVAAYRAIGKMMAELAGDDCLAIYCPELEACNEYDARLLDVLRGDDPLALFGLPTFVPVVGVRADDRRMAAAVAEARRRWPEFVAAFRANTDTERVFSVKAKFVEDDKAEFMWVSVNRIDDETIHGVLDNDPQHLTNVREGQPVAVPVSELNDWLYAEGDDLAGGFTIKVLQGTGRG